MSIVNHEKTVNHISNWIKGYAAKAGVKALILGLSGGVDSALVALLCKKTGLPLICVNMPCHSSSNAYNRARAFADEYGLHIHKVDLSAAHEVVYAQAKVANFPFEGNNENPIAVGGLRSCLRAPTLSYFANAYRGIIVGTGNRSEDNITRYFQKYGDGCVDISPIADLFKSEVYELFAYLSQEMRSDKGLRLADSSVMSREVNVTFMPVGALAIFEAKPTADLWGPDSGQEDEKELGISYDEIEWADREDMRTQGDIGRAYNPISSPGIIFSDKDPTKRPDFYRYTSRQQTVLAKLHQMEKISRHKMNPNLPVCQVRSVLGLVK